MIGTGPGTWGQGEGCPKACWEGGTEASPDWTNLGRWGWELGLEE